MMSLVSPGGDRAEHHAPAPAKRFDAEGLDLVDLGLDRGSIYRPLRHGQAALIPAADVLGFVEDSLPASMR
jgi:hypothetical protein